jgi:hypothetical protein
MTKRTTSRGRIGASQGLARKPEESVQTPVPGNRTSFSR